MYISQTIRYNKFTEEGKQHKTNEEINTFLRAKQLDQNKISKFQVYKFFSTL